MHLIINLVFLTSFQFINLSNLALWVNNRRKWITVIFLNLCDNFLYYTICFFLLSLVFAFIYLFIFVLSTYFRHWPNPTTDKIIYFAVLTKTFLNFTFFFFFFLSLVFIFAQLPINKEQTDKNYTNIFSNLYKLYSLTFSVTAWWVSHFLCLALASPFLFFSFFLFFLCFCFSVWFWGLTDG